MRFLFSSTPGWGHVIALTPLARAIVQAGDEVALLSGSGGAAIFIPYPVPGTPAGKAFTEFRVADAQRVTAALSPLGGGPSMEEAAEVLAGSRVDSMADEAVRLAAEWGPDLIVAEVADAVGPLVASALGVPWVAHSIGAQLPEAFDIAMADVAEARYRSRSLTSSARRAYLDICPDELQPAGRRRPVDRLAVRPEPLPAVSDDRSEAHASDGQCRPTALVSLGTEVDNSELLAAATWSLSNAGFDVSVTSSPAGSAALPSDCLKLTGGVGTVRSVGFLPLASALDDADVVVSVGGMGTVLGVLARGVPLVLLPQLPTQRQIGTSAAAVDCAVVIADGADAAGAAMTAMRSPVQKDGRSRIRAVIAAMPSAMEAHRELRRLVSHATYYPAGGGGGGVAAPLLAVPFSSRVAQKPG